MADFSADAAGIQNLARSAGLRAWLEGTCIQVENAAKRSIMSGTGSGRVYELYNPRRTHQASAPGEAPSQDQGLLSSSITHEVVEGSNGLVGRIGSSIVYAHAQEVGYGKLAPRPYLRPALASVMAGGTG